MKLPIGIQTFRKIRSEGYLYIDKTGYIPSLLKASPYIFLSRPRRFGKSLFVSTLESFFRGERELFKGLTVDTLMPDAWEIYPVIHIDLSGENYESVQSLESKLNSILLGFEFELNLPDTSEMTFSERLRQIVHKLHENTGNKVVILIDEYDNPITSTIDTPELQEQLRRMLYGFYSSLKSLDGHIHFCLLTGVTKYGHLSVFSGLNNLFDISMMNEFAGICGITEKEIHSDLKDEVKVLAEEEGLDIDQTYDLLKEWYDGYHFSKSMLDVYNPFSVMNAFARREISDYWYQSGTPTLLVKALMQQKADITELNGIRASSNMLDNISAMKINPVALFYQTGYLTLKDYNRTTKLYTLGYPNKEIESSLMASVLNSYGNISDSRVLISQLIYDLEEGKVEEFIVLLKSFFADIPFDLRRNVEKYENYYHTVFYVLLRLLGMDVDAEYHTSEGSIDIVIKTTEYIYIIELKINGTADDAIRQINERHYSDAFTTDKRKLIKLGIGFAESTHTIDSYIIQD